MRRKPTGPPVREVRCPFCWDRVLWADDDPVAIFGDGASGPDLVEIGHLPEARKAELRWRGYRLCPNPSDDTAEHWLPAMLGNFPDPLVIGFVGASGSGKTHLLAAMVREVLLDRLAPYGVAFDIVDRRRHRRFQSQIELLDRGIVLDGTPRGAFGYTDMLLLRRNRDGRGRLVIFFDVAGEDLRHAETVRGAAASRFFQGAPALIFTHAAADRPLGGTAENGQVFGLALERATLGTRPEQRPAVIALTKADRLRFVPPVDRWLREPSGKLDASAARAESKDVYAYLHRIGDGAVLTPFARFPRCTLHAVSASGDDAVDRPDAPSFFVRPRPIRVLEPLVAILAMAGVLDGPEAAQVGLP